MRKILWFVVSGMMVLSLLVAACRPAATTTTPTTTTAPSRVSAAPNESVVTAKVLGVIQREREGDDPWEWEMVVEIQASEDVPGLPEWYNILKDRVGETITIRVSSKDASELEKGQIITARVRWSGDEHTPAFFYARDIKKRSE